MKTLVISFLLVFPFLVMAQQDTAQIKVIEPADSTGFGIPDGKQVSKELGSSGGRIASGDGKVELFFPIGALTTNTLISIQATTNPAPNGSGKAYQFEPSGIQFKKPVQIIFHYTEEEAATGSADLMGLAMQDINGKWTFINYVEWDSISKTLTGFIHHFSGASNVHKLLMMTGRDEIAVSDTTDLVFLDISKKFGPNEMGLPEDEFMVGSFEKRQTVIWYVNGIPGGNNKEGTASSTTFAVGKEKYLLGKYKAPDIMPGRNPVIIWAEVYFVDKTKKKKLQRRLQCKVSVYDAYTIQVIDEFTGRAGMGSQLIDSASFDVYLFPERIEISNIKNYEPIIIKEGKMGPFKEKIKVKDALGPINITQFIKNDSVSHSYPPLVHFEFHNQQLPGLISKYTARGIDSPPEMLMLMSVPDEINFIANGEDQHYNVMGTTYKLIVKPLRQ